MSFKRNSVIRYPSPIKRIPQISISVDSVDYGDMTTNLTVAWLTPKSVLYKYNGEILISTTDLGLPEDLDESSWLAGTNLPGQNSKGETAEETVNLSNVAFDSYIYARVRVGRGPNNWGSYGYTKQLNSVESYGYSGNVTGHYDRSQSTIGFTVTDLGGGIYARTFTISPVTDTYDVYIGGIKYSLGEMSVDIDDTDGLWTIYLDYVDGQVQLISIHGFPGMGYALTAIIYWNSDINKGMLSDERHGSDMSATTHEYLHNTIGVRYYYGLALSESLGTLTITPGAIYDEDIRLDITEQGKCIILYKNGKSSYEWDENSAVYYKLGVNSRVCYNNGLDLVEADASNKYVAYWIFASNVIDYPILSLAGQNISNTVAAARSINVYQDLALSDLPSKEMKLLYRVIVKTDGKYQEAQDLRNVVNLPSSTYLATDHRTLSYIGTMTHDELEAAIAGITSHYVYIGYASDDDGTDFTLTFDPDLDYIAILSTDTELDPPVVGDFAGLWKNYKGEDGEAGAGAYVYVAYASDDEGTDFTLKYDPDLNYIAILATTTELDPPVVGDFAGLWKKYGGVPVFYISETDPDNGVGQDGDFYAKYVDI